MCLFYEIVKILERAKTGINIKYENPRELGSDRICNAVEPDAVTIEEGLALVAVVGRGMIKSKGTAVRVFKAVADAGINIRMIDQGSSELNIIIGVDEADFEKAMRAIYAEFVS